MTNNVAGALCYALGLITGILFLVLEPYNKVRFIRFHAFQSIFFNIAWIVLWYGLHFVLSMVGLFLLVLYPLIGLAGFLLWLFLMFKAYNNEEFKLPVIGDLAAKQAGQ